MKKFLLALLVVAAPAAVFTSCSDDDDPTLADSVKGTYESTFEVTGLAEGSMSVKITKTGDEEIKISFGSFKVLGDVATVTIGDIEGLKITGEEGNVKINEATKDISLDVSLVPTDIEDAKVTISGTVKDGKDLVLSAVVTSETLKGFNDALGTLVIDVKGTK